MDDGEGGRAPLNFDEKSFLFEWLVENNKTLTRKNKELLVENLKLRSRVEELEKINFVDPTTGLHNRWYLQPRLEEEFSRRDGQARPCRAFSSISTTSRPSMTDSAISSATRFSGTRPTC